MKPGDEVVTLAPLWYLGEDISNRLGVIVSTSGHVLVKLYNYHSNPVKCFRNEIEVIERTRTAMDDWFEEMMNEDTAH